MFTKEEQKLINQVLNKELNFNLLSEEDLFDIEEKIADQLVLHELDENYNPSKIGIMCEEILFKLSEN